jgi:hypothetical protein
MKITLTTRLILFIVLPLCFANGETVPFNSVDDSDVDQAQCRYSQGNTHPYREEVIQKYAAADPEGRGAEFEVNGIRFRDESPALVFRFMQLTTPIDSSKDRHAPDLKSFGIPSDCSKVRCALDAIFSPALAEKMLFLLIAYDVNVSPYRNVNADLPNERELDTFIDAFDLTPPFLTQIELDKKMIRFNRGYIRKGQPRVMANSAMEFFDRWSEHTRQTRIYAIIHEFAHNWARTRTLKWDESPEWLKATGWRHVVDDSTDTWNSEAVRGFISQYAQESPKEDFAESATAYRFAPERLRRISPERYEFMKNIIFAGIEFGGNKPNCEPTNEKMGQVQERFDHMTGSENELNARLPLIMPLCQEDLLETHLDPHSRHKLRRCVEWEFMRLALSESTGQPLSTIPRYLIHPFTAGTRSISEKTFNQAIAFGNQNLKKYCDLKNTGEFIGDISKSALERRLREERGLGGSGASAKDDDRLRLDVPLLRWVLLKLCK